jgi:hypothetical protein
MTLFGVPGKGLDLYHIGVTVPDIHAAMEQYSASFGFTWARIRESAPEVIADGERRRAEIAVTYSVQGPPYLELVQERSGSIWGADGFALSHVGFWAEDLAAGQRALDESGLVARVHDIGPDGRAARYSYHPFAGGLWIELVHTSFQAQLSGWIADTLRELGELGEQA